ncbi:MAG TPA: hypothetical protein VF629_07925, partial [Hymenobacter sp.]
MTHFTLWLRRLAAVSIGVLLPAWAGAQSWQWAVTPVTNAQGFSRVAAVALDGTGGLVVTGIFSGTVAFGATALTSVGAQDLYVARLDESGAWTQAVRGPAGAAPGALAVDAAGTAVVAGQFAGPSATFGTFPLANAGTGTTTDLFVARLSAAGAWTQAVRGGGAGAEEATALALDAAGNAVVAGTYRDAATAFGAATLSNGGGFDVFVARLSAAGAWTQAVGAGSSGSDVARALALDASGTAHVAGDFDSFSVRFGAVTVANSTDGTGGIGTFSTPFVASLTAAGTWARAVRATSSGSMTAVGLAGDGAGNLVVTGHFTGQTARFGLLSLSNVNPRSNGISADVYVARLSAAGAWTQAVGAGGPGSDRPAGLALDGQGNAVVVGTFQGATATFGPTVLTNTTVPVPPSEDTVPDAFVARLSAAGAWTQAVGAGGPEQDAALDAAVDATGGRVFITGGFQGPSAFGPTVLASASAVSAAFVARVGGLPLGTANSVVARARLTLSPNPAR